MFSQLIGKPMKRYDVSVFENYPPDKILQYHHHQSLEIEFQTYRHLKNIASDAESENPTVASWLSFIDEVLKAKNDLETCFEGHPSTVLGPYYYTRTNTAVYFTPAQPAAEAITLEDLHYLSSLAEPPVPNNTVVKYYQSLKKQT